MSGGMKKGLDFGQLMLYFADSIWVTAHKAPGKHRPRSVGSRRESTVDAKAINFPMRTQIWEAT